MQLPEDIAAKISQDFTDEDKDEVRLILTETFTEHHNVGTIIQCIRAILFLSEGDVSKVRDYCLPYLSEDPRDLIMEAVEAAGNPGHWFGIPFDEMEYFTGELPERKSNEEGDNLPF